MWYFRSDEYECTDKSIELNEHTDEDANKQDIKSFNLISNIVIIKAGADQPIAFTVQPEKNLHFRTFLQNVSPLMIWTFIQNEQPNTF